jgi:hypothetical protein
MRKLYYCEPYVWLARLSDSGGEIDAHESRFAIGSKPSRNTAQMPSMLIVYDTTESQTRKIAQRMADAVASAGHQVDLNEVNTELASLR